MTQMVKLWIVLSVLSMLAFFWTPSNSEIHKISGFALGVCVSLEMLAIAVSAVSLKDEEKGSSSRDCNGQSDTGTIPQDGCQKQSGSILFEEGGVVSTVEAKVDVGFDRVIRKGALASGTVKFSDGVTGSWYLDRMGRLSLADVSRPNYQPLSSDLEKFQAVLLTKLSQTNS